MSLLCQQTCVHMQSIQSHWVHHYPIHGAKEKDVPKLSQASCIVVDMSKSRGGGEKDTEDDDEERLNHPKLHKEASLVIGRSSSRSNDIVSPRPEGLDETVADSERVVRLYFLF